MTAAHNITSLQRRKDDILAELTAPEATAPPGQQLDETQFESAGYAAAAAGRPRTPLADATVMATLAGRAVGDPTNTSVMTAYLNGYQRRCDEEAAALFDATDSSAQTKHRNTRGPNADSAAAPDHIHSTYQEHLTAAANSFQQEKAWESDAVTTARHAYGPGTHRLQIPPELPPPATMSDRDLLNMENDIFYLQPVDGPGPQWLPGARRELIRRGLGPKTR